MKLQIQALPHVFVIGGERFRYLWFLMVVGIAELIAKQLEKEIV